MIEVDYSADIDIERTSTETVVRIPLTEPPSLAWLSVFRRLEAAGEVIAQDAGHGDAWIQVRLGGEMDSRAAVAKLDNAVRLVAMTNLEVEAVDQNMVRCNQAIQAWWTSKAAG
jgi:hypothetical protein